MEMKFLMNFRWDLLIEKKKKITFLIIFFIFIHIHIFNSITLKMVYNKESDPRTTWPFLSGSDLHEKVTRTNSQIPQTHKDEINKNEINLLQLPLDLLLEIFSWLSHGELIQ